jgi:hypothetical protein
VKPGDNDFIEDRIRMRVPEKALPALLSSAFLLCLGTNASAGPFGLERGMTKEQIIKIIGQKAVKEIKGDKLVTTTVPTPHDAFESYSLIISPKLGLLKIIAVGKDIDTSVYGDQIRSSFSEIKEAVSKVYDGRQDFDYLQAGSIWNEGKEWMMGLLRKERSLITFWQPTGQPNHIVDIQLEATALNQERGYLTLSYEFEGWSSYLDSQRDQKNSVF